MRLKKINPSQFAAGKKIVSLVLAVALCITFLPGGLLRPLKVSAASNHTINSGPLTIAAGSGDWVITGTGAATTNTITVASGYQGQITLNNVNIRTTGNVAASAPAMLINGSGSLSNVNTKVALVLVGTNYLYSGNSTSAVRAGLEVWQGGQVEIQTADGKNDSGSLEARCGAYSGATYTSGAGAGIGAGNVAGSGGNIVIKSGTITAYAGFHGAAIGGAWSNIYNGYIAVYGGIVDCQGGGHGAGIGGGCYNTGAGTYVPGSNQRGSTSIVVAFPPAEITAVGGKLVYPQSSYDYVVGMVKSATYIGDPNSPKLQISTETHEQNANIYGDISKNPNIIEAFTALNINDVMLTRVPFGKTAANGVLEQRAELTTATPIYTDATSTSTDPTKFGKPFEPKSVTTPQGATGNTVVPVVLPLLQRDLSLTKTDATPLVEGYSSADADNNAFTLKMTYNDPQDLENVTFNLTGDAQGNNHFKNIKFFAADGTTPISTPPTKLTNGDVYILRIPLADNKLVNLYQATLEMEFDFSLGQGTTTTRLPLLYPIDQKVTKLDTNNQYIKLTTTRPTFVSNSTSVETVPLLLLINHTGSGVDFKAQDVKGFYIITNKANYADIDPADPDWKPLNTPASENTGTLTSATFPVNFAAGTHYIHWRAESGLITSHSKDFPASGGAPTYGAFGPYIIDKTAPTLAISGPSSNQTGDFEVLFDFDKVVTGFVAGDIVVSNGTLVSGSLTLDTTAPAGTTRYKATISPALVASGNVTVAVKKTGTTPNIGAVDAAGNKVTSPVADLVVPFTRNFSYTLDKSGDFSYAYGTLVVPNVTMTVTNNGDQELVPEATAVTLSDNVNFSVTQPTGSIMPGANNQFVLSVNNPNTINVGTYTVTVNTKYKNGSAGGLTESKAVTLTVNKATSGGGSTLTTSPGINTTSNKYASTAITLTPNAGLTNTIQSWKYRIYPVGTTPPATWQTPVGTAPVNANFPGTGEYAIDWEMVNSNYADTSGTLSPYHILLDYQCSITGNNTMTYSYGGTVAPLTLTINNTGNQVLVPETPTVTLSGTDAAKFSVTQPAAGNISVGGNKTVSLSVLAPGTLNAGTYTVDVKVKYQNAPEKTHTVTLTVTKGTPGAGQGGTIAAAPGPNTAATPRNTTAVLLTPNTGTPNAVVSWKYRIYPVGTTPPTTWQTETGSAPVNTNFSGTGVYSIDWEIVNSNYTDTSGTLTPFHIDQVRPKINPLLNVAPSVAGAAPFTVELSFDKDITNLSSINNTWLGSLQNCTITSVTRKGASDRTFVVAVQPSAGLANGASVGFTLLDGKGTDSAVNTNTAYSFSLTYNSNSPYVASSPFPPYFSGNVYNAVTTGNFDFIVRSNGAGIDKTLYNAAATALSSGNVGSFVEVKRGTTILSAGTDYTLTYTAATDGGTIRVVPTGAGFGEGAYTITIKQGIKNFEGNAMAAPYTQNFEVRIPTIGTGTTAFTASPSALPYTGGVVTVRMEGTNLQYAAPGSIKFEVQNPGAGSFTTLAVSPTLTVAADGTSATFATTLPLNSDNTAKAYIYRGYLGSTQVGSNQTCTVAAATPDWSGSDHGIIANPTSYATYVGGTVSLTVKGVNLHNYSNLQIQVTEGATAVATIAIPASDLQPNGTSTVVKTHVIPDNLTNAGKTYTYTLFDGITDLTTAAGTKAKATVTIAPATPQITKLEGNLNGVIGSALGGPIVVDEMGGVLHLLLEGVHLHNFNPLTVNSYVSGTTTPSDATPNMATNTAPTTGPGSMAQTYTFTLPENTTQTDKSYDFVITKGGTSHIVTVVVQTAAIDLDGVGYGLSASPDAFNFRGGTTTLTLKGRNLYHYSDLKIKVEKNGSWVQDIPTITTAHGEVTLNATQLCARNDTTIEDVYTFKLFDGTTDLNKTATVRVAPSVPLVNAFTVSDSTTSAGSTTLTLEDGGGTVYFTVSGQHLHNFTTMQIDGTPAVGAITLSGLANDNDEGTTTVVLPANRTLADQTYTYTLENAGTPRQVTITVKKPEVGPREVKAVPAELSAAGGNSTFTVTGINMEIAPLELHSKDNPTEVHTMPTVGTHVSDSQVTLGFSGHSGGLRNDIYEYEVYFDGQASGLTATVEVGDSVPNLTGLVANPSRYATVDDTLNGRGRSEITVQGNYLFNFSELKLYDELYDQYYTVQNAGKDMEASYTVAVPSAVGIFRYVLFCEGVETQYSVEIRVGVAPGESGPPSAAGDDDEKENTHKYWSRRGGGAKGGGFTGRVYVPFDVLRYQCEVAAKEDPQEPSVVLRNVGILTSRHFNLAWAGGKSGARLSKKTGDGIMTLKLDTSTRTDENVLEGRLYVLLDAPLLDVYPGVYLDAVETGETEALFRSRFTNKNLEVICLDQDGSYGTTVEVAAAANLDGFNKSQLYFYRYDRETGKFETMKNTNHFIDTERFLHFQTGNGGDIIVTDMPLEESGRQSESGSFPLDMKKEDKAEKNLGGTLR